MASPLNKVKPGVKTIDVPVSSPTPYDNLITQIGGAGSVGVVKGSGSMFPNPSPLTNSAVVPAQQNNIQIQLAVKDSDIDKLGSDLSRAVGATTEKIVQKMGVSQFDELGKILASVSTEVGKLDPASLQKRGISGWIQRRFGDVKKELTLRLKSADAVFTDLSAQISNHIAVHTNWVNDLEVLYNENFERYNNITAVLKQGEVWKESLKSSIDNWPKIDPDDPDAQMKIQAKRDAQDVLNRLEIKLDSFVRLKAITESNAPKIKSQQNTSKTTIKTLKDVIEQTIPMVKMEFALFIQSLDAQKSIQIVDNAKQLANTTLIRSADTAKQTSIDAAKQLNNPVIQTATISHIQNRMLETLAEVKNIETTARQVREQDALAIAASQKTYLQNLQGNI